MCFFIFLVFKIVILFIYTDTVGIICAVNMQTMKLFVQPTETSFRLLVYLNKNITDINKLGARVRIDKIGKEVDEDLMEEFRRVGITRLPALVSPDGKVFIGVKKITEVFEKNLGKLHNTARVGPVTGDDTDISNYWLKELYSGTDGNGKMVPRKDEEADEQADETKDIERKIAMYTANRPKHHVPKDDRSLQTPTRPGRGGGRGGTADIGDIEQHMYNNLMDNIQDDPYEIARPRVVPKLESTDDAAGDTMDQRMLAAMMDKTL